MGGIAGDEPHDVGVQQRRTLQKRVDSIHLLHVPGDLAEVLELVLR